MDLINALAGIPGIGPVLPYVVLAIAVASALAPFLPAPEASSARGYASLYAVVNFVAVNFGNARNGGPAVARPIAVNPVAVIEAAAPVIAAQAASSLAAIPSQLRKTGGP